MTGMLNEHARFANTSRRRPGKQRRRPKISKTLELSKILTAGLVAGVATFSGNAMADVSPSGKGIAGGVLLGAELSVFTEGLLGVQSGWAYALGAGAGGAAGGAAGFLIEDTDSAGVPMVMLTTGMALVVPATIVIMSSTRYTPPETPADQGASSTTVSNNQQTAAHRPTLSQPQAVARTTPLLYSNPASRLPMSAISLDVWQATTLRLSLPAVEIRDSYTAEELAIFGVEQKTELRIPVFDLVF